MKKVVDTFASLPQYIVQEIGAVRHVAAPLGSVNESFKGGKFKEEENNANEKESCQEKGGKEEIVHYNRDTLWPSQARRPFC